MKRFLLLFTTAAVLILPTIAFAHGYGHVMGTIDSFEENTLTVTSTEGETVTVKLTDTTKILKGKKDGTRDDIVAGSRVVVHFAKDKSAAEVHLPAAE